MDSMDAQLVGPDVSFTDIDHSVFGPTGILAVNARN